jgi:hypothetical protein
MAKMLKVKILAYLPKVGPKGAQRTHLLQRFAAKAAELDRTMKILLAEGKVVAWTVETKGRPCTTYYDAEVAKTLTPPENQVTPEEPTELNLDKPGSTCKTCGRFIAAPVRGRPYVYCSQLCRRGGNSMQAFLARAQSDVRVFAEVALLLVMADLRMRGYDVARPFYRTGQRVLVTDDAGGAFLDIVPLGIDGRLIDLNEYQAAAAVFRDGRIVYGGREPIFPPDGEPEPIDDGDVAPEEEEEEKEGERQDETQT